MFDPLRKNRKKITKSRCSAVEIVGAFLGYFAVSVVSEILEFALAFAGGCMLYVIFDEMIPEAREGGGGQAVTYAAILGFSERTLFCSRYSSKIGASSA